MSDEDIRTFLHDTCCPIGHMYTLVLISLTKRILKEEMPASYRLQFLEHLEKLRDNWLTADTVAAVEPVCDKGYEIIREVQKLGASKALDVYAKHFKTFAGLNPSLIADGRGRASDGVGGCEGCLQQHASGVAGVCRLDQGCGHCELPRNSRFLRGEWFCRWASSDPV